MRSSWTPALVPIDQPTVYLVADDFGPSGKAWREVDLETTNLETVIQDLMAGEYKRPIKSRGLQYGRSLVGGCVGGCRTRNPASLRYETE